MNKTTCSRYTVKVSAGQLDSHTKPFIPSAINQ
jgi:hypothetical protein